MANHVSHAALPFPVKNARYTIAIPYLDADGDPTDPTTPDTEVSKDGGTYADCTEEATTVSGTATGTGYLTLTATEMDASLITVVAKATSGPKSTVMVLNPRVLPVIFSGTATAGAAGSITLATDIPAVADLLIGCIVKTTGGTGGGTTNNQARVITDFTTGRVASVVPNWEVTPSTDTTYEVLLTELSVLSFADVKLFNGTAGTFASGRPEVNVTHFNGTAATAAAGRPEVNTTHVAGTAQTARDLGANIDATTSSRATPAQVNAEVLDVLNVDTFAEPAAGAPAATATLVAKIGLLFRSWRNKKANDGSENIYYMDDGTTVATRETTVASGGTTTVGEKAAP